jgi:ribosomal protein S12 methylthiotransferase accessory factor
LADAAKGAVLEMTQMELAHAVVAAKRREAGDTALNEADHGHLRRRDHLDVARCALLHPLPPGPAHPDMPTDHALANLVAHLASRGLPSFAVDLTRRAFDVPVVQVVCPGLEKEPSRLSGTRLHATISATGGGGAYTGGIPLM